MLLEQRELAAVGCSESFDKKHIPLAATVCRVGPPIKTDHMHIMTNGFVTRQSSLGYHVGKETQQYGTTMLATTL